MDTECIFSRLIPANCVRFAVSLYDHVSVMNHDVTVDVPVHLSIHVGTINIAVWKDSNLICHRKSPFELIAAVAGCGMPRHSLKLRQNSVHNRFCKSRTAWICMAAQACPVTPLNCDFQWATSSTRASRWGRVRRRRGDARSWGACSSAGSTATWPRGRPKLSPPTTFRCWKRNSGMRVSAETTNIQTRRQNNLFVTWGKCELCGATKHYFLLSFLLSFHGFLALGNSSAG